jgi:hypothetical protein
MYRYMGGSGGDEVFGGRCGIESWAAYRSMWGKVRDRKLGCL